MAVIDSRAHGDPHRVEIADERVATCAQRVRRAALALDRVVTDQRHETGDATSTIMKILTDNNLVG